MARRAVTTRTHVVARPVLIGERTYGAGEKVDLTRRAARYLVLQGAIAPEPDSTPEPDPPPKKGK